MVWRTRLSIIFTVLRVLFILFFGYAIYKIVISSYYDSAHKGEEFDRYVTTYIETHETGLQVEKTGVQEAILSPFLTQKTSLKLYQTVGDRDVVIGKVKATDSLMVHTIFNLDLKEDYLNQQSTYDFALPPDLSGKGQVSQKDKVSEGVWSTLNKIDDGHVAQVAFSTKQGMSPEALGKALAPYDLKLLQMPVYSGELKTIKDVPFSSGGDGTDQMYYVSHLTLRPWIVSYDSKNRLSSEYYEEDSQTMKRAAKQLITDVQWLQKNGDYDEQKADAKRLDYLKQHGVKVYGAVVTGPVRELEKLQNNKNFYQFQLGRMENWNWH
nr:anti sigma factor C-terminal domain-containing protein [Pullulanibacillus pueri]